MVPHSVLVDRFGRPLKNLRIVVTTRCNYRCVYCHGEGVELGREEVLNPRNIFLISLAARSLGISSVKITGGEPLVRSDVDRIIKSIVDAGIGDVSMTTNGFFLAERAGDLAEAGLKRVCVSIPSLDEERYRFVTRVDGLDRVLKGLEEAYRYGLRPITINVVVLKFFELTDLERFIDLASRYEARLRLIELEPLGLGAESFSRMHRDISDLIQFLERGCSKKYVRELNFRPVYVMSNGVEVEIVSWFGNTKFCAGCDRIRLTPWLSLKPCIARSDEVALKECFERYEDEKSVVECIRRKFVEANELRRPFNAYPINAQ